MAFNQSAQLKKEFALPMVPGLSCGEEMLRRNYHRQQVTGHTPEYGTTIQGLPATAYPGGFDPSTGAGATVVSTNMLGTSGKAYAATAATTKAADGHRPNMTGVVLRYFGYTVETVEDSSQETERVRQVSINFFLEDGTMSVTESLGENTGIAFPANLKRHIVPNPDGTPIVAAQLRIGEPITFYGKTFLIVDADSFTRQLCQDAGEELPPAIQVPTDVYTTSRSRAQAKAHDIRSIAASSPLNITLSAEQVRATQRFLEHDRKVLRCDCTWDDSDRLHGSVHFLTLYYFLSDGSLALVWKDTQNSGRDPFPTFFSRQRIPKPSGPDGKFDSTTLGAVTFEEHKDTVYYSDEDIRIGNVLNLYGRQVKIHDYNEYTRTYLKDTFGLTDYAPIPGATPPPFMPPGAVRRELTARELAEHHQKKVDDLRRHRFANSVVKFLMRLETGKSEDSVRRFVLAVYPADDTFSIFEPSIRNSGIVGGKFLQRQKVHRPGSEEFYTADDFFVGAQVSLNSFPFVILSSDEHSLQYMESNTEEFSHSDINKIVRKMQAMLCSSQTGLADAFCKADENQRSGLDMSVFLSIMQSLKLDLTEQEILTVLRYFDKNQESYVSYQEVACRVVPDNAQIGADDRSWQEIYEASVKEERAAFVTDPEGDKKRAKEARDAVSAARGAAELLRHYEERRQLVMKELHAITDYAKDSLIGETEFLMCARGKLDLSSISDDELRCLSKQLFPATVPRVTYEELMRLFNGTSNYAHTLKSIAAGTPKQK